jgi:uncharacterized repeat protein (TIGR03803 family)
LDSAGNLYGTMPEAGLYNGGVLFELSPTGTGWAETVLHSFGGPGDGTAPANGVIMDPKTGNLYGLTAGNSYQSYTPAMVYELSQSAGSWVESIIYTLPNQDEVTATARLVMDAAGNIYGNSSKTVFELSPNGQGGWNPAVLHTFTVPPSSDGYGANGTPVLDSAGNLYGATTLGGSKDCGTVYKLSPGKTGVWIEKILYSFACTVAAYEPVSGIVLDAQLNIYGTLETGGSFGDGAVFELVAPVGTGSYKQKTLFSFGANTGCSLYWDGRNPLANLTWDSAGHLYGTTESGGTVCNGPIGYGVVFEVNPSAAATTTTLSSSPNPSVYGQTVVFSATITSSNGAPPDGETVTFEQGTTVLGTGTLSGGTATFADSTLAVGTKPITAVYGFDFNFIGSKSKTDSQVISKASTTTALSSSQNPSSYGQSVMFTATVTPQYSGTPTGSVTFYNGIATLGSAALVNGVASYTTTKLAVGTATITAEYKGSSSFLASTSTALSQVVNAATTTTTLASSLNPSNSGQSVTFTATIAGQFGGTVTGSVTFMDGTTLLATVNLSGSVAKYTTKTLASGSHDIAATYNGSTDFTGSSGGLTQTVN